MSKVSSNYLFTVSINADFLTCPDLSGFPPNATKASTELYIIYDISSLQELILDHSNLFPSLTRQPDLEQHLCRELEFLYWRFIYWFGPFFPGLHWVRCLNKLRDAFKDVDHVVEADAPIALLCFLEQVLNFLILSSGKNTPFLI